MKKGLVLILVALFVSCTAFAGPIDLNLTNLDLPDAKPGFIVSLENEGIEACLTTTLIEHKSKYLNVNLDVGAAPAINEPIVGLAMKFGDLSQYGINFPLRKYFDISIGGYVGFELNDYYADDSRKWEDAVDFGIYTTIARIQF